MSWRCSLLTEPWWARASTAGAPGRGARLRHHLRRGAAAGMPRGSASGGLVALRASRMVSSRSSQISLSRAVSRSASRRELAKTRVDRWDGDQVDDALLDVRPDRGPPLGTRGGAGQVVLDDLAEGGHVGDRDDDLEVPLLGRRRADDLDRPAAGEVAGHLVDGLDRGGQPDPLGRLVEQRVEPLEGEREVGAALGAGDGVHLVEDHRLDAGERLAGLRGEDEEQRLGRGDEHVGGRAGEGAPLAGGGVAGPHRHGDVGRRQAEPGGGVADADEG